jgi:hypothetical protein
MTGLPMLVRDAVLRVGAVRTVAHRLTMVHLMATPVTMIAVVGHLGSHLHRAVRRSIAFGVRGRSLGLGKCCTRKKLGPAPKQCFYIRAHIPWFPRLQIFVEHDPYS